MGTVQVHIDDIPNIQGNVTALANLYLRRGTDDSFLTRIGQKLHGAAEHPKFSVSVRPDELTPAVYALTGRDEAFIFPRPAPMLLVYRFEVHEKTSELGASVTLTKNSINGRLEDRLPLLERYVQQTKGVTTNGIMDMITDEVRSGLLNDDERQYIKDHELYSALAWRAQLKQELSRWQDDTVHLHISLVRALHYAVTFPTRGIVEGKPRTRILDHTGEFSKYITSEEVSTMLTAPHPHKAINTLRDAVIQMMCSKYYKHFEQPSYD